MGGRRQRSCYRPRPTQSFSRRAGTARPGLERWTLPRSRVMWRSPTASPLPATARVGMRLIHSRTARRWPRSRSIRIPGGVILLGYHAVDDYGALVNPLLTTGEVHGGLAQGIGQAL